MMKLAAIVAVAGGLAGCATQHDIREATRVIVQSLHDASEQASNEHLSLASDSAREELSRRVDSAEVRHAERERRLIELETQAARREAHLRELIAASTQTAAGFGGPVGQVIGGPIGQLIASVGQVAEDLDDVRTELEAKGAPGPEDLAAVALGLAAAGGLGGVLSKAGKSRADARVSTLEARIGALTPANS